MRNIPPTAPIGNGFARGQAQKQNLMTFIVVHGERVGAHVSRSKPSNSKMGCLNWGQYVSTLKRGLNHQPIGVG